MIADNKLSKRDKDSKIVLMLDDFDFKERNRFKRFEIITITGLHYIADDYGDKHKMDKGINNKGTEFYETAAPILGWWWYTKRKRTGTFKDITKFGYGIFGSNANRLVNDWSKLAPNNVKNIVGKCRKHKKLYYKKNGCYLCDWGSKKVEKEYS